MPRFARTQLSVFISTILFILAPLLGQQVDEKAQDRISSGGLPIHGVDENIEAALDRMCMALEFVETPLADVTKHLENTYEINVLIDVRALEAIGLGSDTPITVMLRGISLRSALRLMLRDLDLTYMVLDGVLMVTTPEEAEAHLSTVLYEVSDLVTTIPTDIESKVYSPHTATSGFDQLINTVTATINPESWSQVGGPGAIEALRYGKKHVLVVSQPREVHENIGLLFHSLRSIQPAARAASADALVGKRPQKLNDTYFVRIYPIADSKAVSQDGQELAQLVELALGKKTWKEGGCFVRGTAGTVIVKHNAAVHEEVYQWLSSLQAIQGATHQQQQNERAGGGDTF